jgi:hypothetical protein
MDAGLTASVRVSTLAARSERPEIRLDVTVELTLPDAMA